jgi:hypothetical protein
MSNVALEEEGISGLRLRWVKLYRNQNRKFVFQ